MTKNSLGDLQNHLFAQLERLGDEDLTGEELDEEIKRAKAVGDIGKTIIANANTAIKAMQAADMLGHNTQAPDRMLSLRSGD